MKTSLVKDGERLDDLGIDNLYIIQDPSTFCFGIDAVLLSDFAKIYKDETVVDLCSGNGILPVLLFAKTKAKKIYGIEIQRALCDIANRSIEYNEISSRIEIICKDLKEIKDSFPPESIDVITVNPPYLKKTSGIENEKEAVRIARFEVMCDFNDIVFASKYLLKVKGRMYIVQRPYRLVEILKTMTENGIEPKMLRFVMPYNDKEPNLVLIEGIKGAKPEMRIMPPLIVYDRPGEYTKELRKIYGYE